MKKIISLLLLTLSFSSFATAQPLRMTINNQSDQPITTDSSLIPQEAKLIAGRDSVIFNMEIPSGSGTERVRYTANTIMGITGCDFFIDISEGMGTYFYHITGVPLDSRSTCTATESAGGVKHLTIYTNKV